MLETSGADNRPAANEAPEPLPARSSLVRAITVGALLVPVNVYWTSVIEVRWYTLDGTSLPLFITPVFLLFALVLVNLQLRKFRPNTALPMKQHEMLLIYMMLVVSCSVAGQDTFQN